MNNSIQLKDWLVVKGPDDDSEIWSRAQYEKYVSGAALVGAGSAYAVITHFNENERLNLAASDSPPTIQGAVWRTPEEKMPQIGDEVLIEFKSGDYQKYKLLIIADDIRAWWVRNVRRWLDESGTPSSIEQG